MLKIYNSISKQKEVFKPREAGKVSLYVCGMTVYDLCHIGHARVMVNFDFVTRYFRYRNYEVTYIRNITDIDDKIIKRANENNEPIHVLTERFIQAMHEDAIALNVLSPSNEPKATDHIPEIIAMIEKLLKKGHAYISASGDVLYEVKTFQSYGKMAHKDIDSLQAGARVEITEDKRSPLDFVLWKMSKPNEPSWESPWGDGRPGWHIECSAMSTHFLGHNFDIHGGGHDLKFPHHQNEIAQSEAATGEKFVNYWMHVGFVTVNKEKMSKSLGNFFTIREVLEKYHAEVIRYFMISSHYRSPVNYSQESLEIAANALSRFYSALRGLPEANVLENTDYEKRFIDAMDDDFNTPEALAVMFDIVRKINSIRETDIDKAAGLGALLQYLGGILGVLSENPDVFLQAIQEFSQEQMAEIEKLINRRNVARTNKDWVLADKVRQQLSQLDVVLEDTSDGTTWRRK